MLSETLIQLISKKKKTDVHVHSCTCTQIIVYVGLCVCVSWCLSLVRFIIWQET